MRMIMTVCVAITLLSASMASPTWATHAQRTCDATATSSVGAWTTAFHTTNVDVRATVGQFAPDPLLATTVEVTAPSCLLIQFTAAPRFPIHDEGGQLVFQIRVDGRPVTGQGHLDIETPRARIPLLEVAEDDVGIYALQAYLLLAPVTPGVHVVEVLYGVLCWGGGDCARTVRSATMTVGYQ